jgi:hypothetical protein
VGIPTNYTVTVNPKVSIGPDKNVDRCYGSAVNLLSVAPANNLTANWTLANVPVADPTNVTASGTYQLIATNSTGCSDTLLVKVNIRPQVIANAGPDAFVGYNEPYQMHGTGGSQYLWTPGNVLNDPTIPTPIATLTNTTDFVLMVQDAIGCADYDTVRLTVLNGPTFYTPNAFTPNGDGLNDVFMPSAAGIARLDYFRVYNRFGVLMFESHDIGRGWDGRYKGELQSVGNYVYVVQGLDRYNKVKFVKGNILLLR